MCLAPIRLLTFVAVGVGVVTFFTFCSTFSIRSLQLGQLPTTSHKFATNCLFELLGQGGDEQRKQRVAQQAAAAAAAAAVAATSASLLSQRDSKRLSATLRQTVALRVRRVRTVLAANARSNL